MRSIIGKLVRDRRRGQAAGAPLSWVPSEGQPRLRLRKTTTTTTTKTTTTGTTTTTINLEQPDVVVAWAQTSSSSRYHLARRMFAPISRLACPVGAAGRRGR